MNFLCWNGQGFVRSRAKRTLRYLVRKHNQSLIWLMETKACIEASNDLKHVLNYPNSFHIHVVGLYGGILLFWNLDIELQIKYVGSTFVVIKIVHSLDEMYIFLVCLSYIPPLLQN